MRRGRVSIGAAAVCLLLLGCDAAPDARRESGPREVIVEVNGEPIRMEDLRASLLAERKSKPLTAIDGKVLGALVDQLIERRLILQQSKALLDPVDDAQVREYVDSIDQAYTPPGLEAVLRNEGIHIGKWRQAVRETLEFEKLLLQEVYSKVVVSEQEIQEAYRKNPGRYRVKRRWRVRQIVVATKEGAQQLRRLIVNGMPFARLAREKSLGPAGAQGGEMGFFEEGQLPESVERVIKRLGENEVSNVVRTSFGFHLFQVTERRSAGLQPLDLVRGKIGRELSEIKGRRRYEKWIGILKKDAAIQYFRKNWENAETG